MFKIINLWLLLGMGMNQKNCRLWSVIPRISQTLTSLPVSWITLWFMKVHGKTKVDYFPSPLLHFATLAVQCRWAEEEFNTSPVHCHIVPGQWSDGGGLGNNVPFKPVLWASTSWVGKNCELLWSTILLDLASACHPAMSLRKHTSFGGGIFHPTF